MIIVIDKNNMISNFYAAEKHGMVLNYRLFNKTNVYKRI